MMEWFRVWPDGKTEAQGEDVLAATAEIAAHEWAEDELEMQRRWRIADSLPAEIESYEADVSVRDPINGQVTRWHVAASWEIGRAHV